MSARTRNPHSATARCPRSGTERSRRDGWRSAPQRLAGCALTALLSACLSPAEYRAEADLEAYEIIDQRRAELGRLDPFTIDPPTDTLRERLLAGEAIETLDLAAVLAVAAENSREYRTRREALFLVALDLTFEQWRFSVQETGTIGAFVEGMGDDATSEGGTGALSFARLFGSGLQVLAGVALESIRIFGTGGTGGFDEVSRLSLTITQPLLRGFGRDIVLEPLTQAERNVLYEARVYERFRSTFAFDVTSRFFDILEQMDTLENESENYRGLQRLRERNEAFAEAGLLKNIEVDQAKQDELRARNRVIAVQRDLESLLDRYKFLLGLPVESELPLDAADLLTIERWGFLEMELPEAAVIDQALASRLDYLTTLERVEDTARRVVVAADALRAGLDLVADVRNTSEFDDPRDFDGDDREWALDLDLDLPLDRLPERNVYRAALIAQDVARRRAEEEADRIVSELRDELRTLVAARESYSIQQNAVELALRRVESTELSLEAGRASTRDVLESQESLVVARNALTGALTVYILSGLALYRDMELLVVTPDGLSVDVEPLLARMEMPTP